MSKTHNHLSLKERAVMQAMLNHGCSTSTISRELARSGSSTWDGLQKKTREKQPEGV